MIWLCLPNAPTEPEELQLDSESLLKAIAEHRNIQHRWHFSPEQQQVSQRYYDANQLLLDCLNSHCEVTDAVRQEIEAALLLPQKELEDREWRGD